MIQLPPLDSQVFLIPIVCATLKHFGTCVSLKQALNMYVNMMIAFLGSPFSKPGEISSIPRAYFEYP